MTDQVPKTQQDLREMVYHTDARVTAMEGQLTSISHSLSRTDQKLGQVISAISAPKDVNWVGLGALALSFIVALAGGAKFMTEYVVLTLDPVQQELTVASNRISGLRDFQHQTHYEFGGLHQRADVWDTEIRRLWEHIHKLEEADDKHSVAIGRAEVSRGAIGDYVRQIDELGSRRWMNEAPARASQVEEGN